MPVPVATDWAVGGGTLALAAATFILAGIALWQARQTRDAVRETYRARVDDLAPRVTVVTLRPAFPPFSPSAYGNPQPWNTHPTFVLPGQANMRILVRTQGHLMNEGGSTAVVEVDAGVTFPDPPIYVRTAVGGPLANRSADPADDVEGLPALSEMVYLKGARWALLPGRVVAFRLTADHTVAEWADAWRRRGTANPMKTRFEIRVMDQYEDGVEDHHTVEVEAYPVVPVEGNAAAWRIPIAVAGDEGYDRADVLPVRRQYRRGARRTLPGWLSRRRQTGSSDATR